MRRLIAYFVLIALNLAFNLVPAHAAKRVALVIGNSAYEHATPLKNPKNDAEAIASALTDVGFEVVKGLDLQHVDFAQTVSTFRKKLRGADVGLLFYAGHGLQVHGSNYLIPIDAELADETALQFEAVPLHVILQLMERETTTNLVFLDACRDNPLARNLARSMGTRSTNIGRGLARVESGLGTLVSFATQPGNVALDGEGSNSPFATGMLKHIATPGLDVELVMRRVREDVIKATSGSQVPWSNSSLTGSFVFRDKKEEKPPAPPVAAVPRGVDPLAVELAFWQAAKDAGTRQAYEAYLKKYPQGSFAPLAGIQISELEQVKAAAQTSNVQEREKLAKERDELARRLKALEDEAKKKAERKQNEEQKVASLQPEASTPAAPVLDAHTMALVLQNELRRVGCDPGKVDGVWGGKGSGALSDFNRHASLKLPTDEPSMAAIEAVKEKTDRVCPLACGPLHNEINGQCVAKTCPSGQQLNSHGQCINVVVQQKPVAKAVKKEPQKKKKNCYQEYSYASAPVYCF